MERKRKIALLAALYIEEEQCVKTYRRWYERPHIFERKKQGDFYSLLQVTRLSDPECCFNILRVTPEIFDNLLSLVSPLIHKKSVGREALPAGLRLGVTLRYLASGDSMCSMSFQHRIGKSTTSAIIKETCESLWLTLMHKVLKMPSKQRWEEIERDFNRMWQVPNCVGAIDGKHVIIQCPHNGGSMYYNYKHTHSIVLLASCDARYRFTMVDIGAYGRQSDGGIFAVSNMGKNILQNNVLVPPPKKLPCTNVSVPHVFLADEAFPLKSNILRPFPGKFLDNRKTIYNYRQSRGRRVIENTFGILAARWRIFRKPIVASVGTVESIIKACVCLHNLMTEISSTKYMPKYYADSDGDAQDGAWRKEPTAAMQPVGQVGCNNHSQEAYNIREAFTEFFSGVGQVEWQWQKV